MSVDKKRVLVVDDDPDFRFQQKVQLEAAGFEVIEAESRKNAEALLEREKFDIAVIDLMMEETDAGFTLSRAIKGKRPDVPVIMITAVASETGLEFDTDTREEKSWIKADALLDKPVRFEQLLREINRLTAA
jgi:CheY-like chemotaxis protein